MEEPSWMLTIRLAYIQELRFLAQMLKLCQVNGSIKLVLVKELKLEIICGFQDISYKE